MLELLLDEPPYRPGDGGLGLRGDFGGTGTEDAQCQSRQLFAVFRGVEARHDFGVPERADPGGRDEAVDFPHHRLFDARGEEIDDFGVMGRDLLLEQRLDGMEEIGIPQGAADHVAQVVGELFGAQEAGGDLVGQDARDACLVLRQEPLPPNAEGTPRQPMPPRPLVGLEQHRDGHPVRQIADGGRHGHRKEPGPNTGRRHPCTGTPQNGQHDHRQGRKEAERKTNDFGGREPADGAGTARVSEDGEFGTVIGEQGHGYSSRPCVQTPGITLGFMPGKPAMHTCRTPVPAFRKMALMDSTLVVSGPRFCRGSPWRAKQKPLRCSSRRLWSGPVQKSAERRACAPRNRRLNRKWTRFSRTSGFAGANHHVCFPRRGWSPKRYGRTDYRKNGLPGQARKRFGPSRHPASQRASSAVRVTAEAAPGVPGADPGTDKIGFCRPFTLLCLTFAGNTAGVLYRDTRFAADF